MPLKLRNRLIGGLSLQGGGRGHGSEETLQDQKGEQGGEEVHGDLQKPDDQAVPGEGLFPGGAGQAGDGPGPPPGKRHDDCIIDPAEEKNAGQITYQEKSIGFQPPESLPAAKIPVQDDPQHRPEAEGLLAVVRDNVCFPVEVLVLVQWRLTSGCTRGCRLAGPRLNCPG